VIRARDRDFGGKMCGKLLVEVEAEAMAGEESLEHPR